MSARKAKTEKAAPTFPVEKREYTYLPAGVKPNPYEGMGDITCDPELVAIRDEEAKANDVPIHPAPEEPSIDPLLVKARDAEIKRDADRSGRTTPERKAPAKKSK